MSWRGLGTNLGLLIGMLATSMSWPDSAAATGFTGLFAPDQWVLQYRIDERDNNNVITQGPVEPTNGITNTECPTDFSNPFIYACIVTDQNDDDIIFLYAQSPNVSNQSTTALWSWTNDPSETNGMTYYISFSYRIEETGNGSPFAYVYVDGEPVSGMITPSASLATISNLRVNPNQTLQFRMTADFDSTVPQNLEISGFSAAVPGPVPATGGAAAFAISRRMRSRMKHRPAQYPSRGSPPDAPTKYLTDYLNLPAGALNSIPVSFEYSTLLAQTRPETDPLLPLSKRAEPSEKSNREA